MIFTMTKELKKIKTKNMKFDIRNQLINNTYIFKENLKLITSKISRLTSRPNLVRKGQNREYSENHQDSIGRDT